ncbi:N-acetylglucosamine-6-phosphate deacetylase [Sphingosinithalassobacter portus]|uniref:N-acetylglucosamine-6-phosphate deacetylase n=1 Tax=Stakelama portus TaxID=2676234 RepID=UPI000D6DF79B|nr:N-acetylglucosamine-6-phosphate deacetylase [Sphingosinithalassobacter portus]
MIERFANGHVVTPTGVLNGGAIDVGDDGLIRSIAPLGDDAAGAVDLDGGWLLPGFIDTQVNGGGGVLFNDAMSVEAIATIGRAHRRFGTTAFMPTLISDEPDRIAAALDAVDAAIAAGVPGLVGIHVEGPFINVERRGIHEARRIRKIDQEAIDLLTRPRAGKVIVTLAPEKCDLDAVRALVAHGVIVSIGHSDAAYEQAQAAMDAGAIGVTHLYNAMSPLAHRAPGVVGAALDDHRVWAGLIVDRVHVHPAAVRIAIAAKGADRIMLVTDAMSSIGTSNRSFDLQGKAIHIRDGSCFYADGTLAGSNLDMATAFRNTVAITGMRPDAVAPMSAGNAARFLGLSERYGTIAEGQRADWTWLSADMQPRGTWIAGTSAEFTDIDRPGIAAE